jgi:hypothetical protein
MQFSGKQRKDSILASQGLPPASGPSKNAANIPTSAANLSSGSNPFNTIMKSPRAPPRMDSFPTGVENFRPLTAPSASSLALAGTPTSAPFKSGLVPGLRARSGSNPNIALSAAQQQQLIQQQQMLLQQSQLQRGTDDDDDADDVSPFAPTPTAASATSAGAFPAPAAAAAAATAAGATFGVPAAAPTPTASSSSSSAFGTATATSAGAAAAGAVTSAAGLQALANKSIQVLVRVRPANARETTALGADANGDSFLRLDPSGAVLVSQAGAHPRQFNFDGVLDRVTSQAAVYEQAGRPVVDSCLAGYHGTILAYGQTGSGKTHTMFGPTLDAAACGEFARAGGAADHRGIIPRILAQLFDRIRSGAADGRTYQCHCSFIEIYNERVIDLMAPPVLNTGPGPVEEPEVIIRHGRAENLVERPITSPEEALAHLRYGNGNRHNGSTLMNAKSSRSHSLFTITITSRRTTEWGAVQSATSKLTLVDLAGSECAKMTGAVGAQLKEASCINKSLSALGMMLRALVKKQEHIPFRDSKLTRLLRDSIGGNNKLCLIANISPSPSSVQETVTTLSFASEARHLPNKALAQTTTTEAAGGAGGLETFYRAFGGDAQLLALVSEMHEHARLALAEQERLRAAVQGVQAQARMLRAVAAAVGVAAAGDAPRGRKRFSAVGNEVSLTHTQESEGADVDTDGERPIEHSDKRISTASTASSASAGSD